MANELGLRLIEELKDNNFILGNILDKARKCNHKEYLRHLIPNAKKKYNKYFEYFIETLIEFILKAGYTKDLANKVCNQLKNFPVIQQADHSNLILDEETFLNNYLFALAIKEKGGDIIINSQCSTVCCFSRRLPPAGPVFLNTRNSLFKVFPFSKRFFKNANFCLIPGPVRTSFDIESGNHQISNDTILSKIVGLEFSTATESFRVCNDIIWNELNLPINRISFDEDLTSQLIIKHILSKDSPIYLLLFDQKIRQNFIKCKNKFINSVQNRVIKNSGTDFFWFKKDAKLIRINISNNNYNKNMILDDNSLLDFSMNPDDIVRELEKQSIYADNFLSYFSRCLLPGIVAIGGTSQQDYLDHYINIILMCNNDTPFIPKEIENMLKNEVLSKLGGAPLLELNNEQKHMINFLTDSSALDEFSKSFLDLPIEETIGSLSKAKYLLSR